jgi:hypothetical protein
MPTFTRTSGPSALNFTPGSSGPRIRLTASVWLQAITPKRPPGLELAHVEAERTRRLAGKHVGKRPVQSVARRVDRHQPHELSNSAGAARYPLSVQ